MTHPVHTATINLSNALSWRRRAFLLLCVLALSFAVRGLTAEFMRVRLMDAGWFQAGTYAIFDNQARDILDGHASAFWIDDPQRTQAAVYPPGYPLWLALVYSVSQERSAYSVQNVQWVLDAISVLLVVGIGVTAYGWRVGLVAGALCALSPLLALYGATPLADAPASWTVLGGVWMLLLAARGRSWKWALTAGLMIGLSCWLRANALLLAAGWAIALLLVLRVAWRERILLAGAVTLGALLLVAPIMVRNALAFHAFLPTGLGVGTNLWEGIGETERAAEFGAVYSDEKLVAQERAAMGLAPDAPLGLYWPNGVERDRARTRRALSVISQHPFWYARVMLRRMWGSLNYAGEPSTFYGFAGINVTSRKCLPQELRGGVLAFFVNILGMVQSVWRHVALLLIVGGVIVSLRTGWRTSTLLLTTALYYLIVGSFMHMEIRYGLPMQAVLIVFAALFASRIFELIRDWRRRKSEGERSNKLREAVEHQT
ncbi:MAG TPA: glycosyltransferase family 39 protein [Pyrinomonadaceae bacterium]|nr:glycosyltransferase family 39 protein [Pyrinomonadaceae bacterium]